MAEGLNDDAAAADGVKALGWAETVTRIAEDRVPEAAFTAAAACFDAKELADPTIAVGSMNAYNRLAIAFRAAPAATERAGAKPA